jgi:hypothetical protein
MLHPGGRQNGCKGFVMTGTDWVRGLMLVVVMVLGSSVWADGGILSGKEKLKVKGCGSGGGPQTVTFLIADDGAWSATADAHTYTGTAVVTGSLRKVDLVFDPASILLLASVLGDQAAFLCRDPVGVTSILVPTSTLKVNKKQTTAKLQVKVTATGVSSQGSGSGKYDLKAKGPWSAAL